MVNLISTAEKRALTVRYYARLAALVLFLFSLGIGVNAILLIPSFILAGNEADAAHRFLGAAEQAVSLGGKGGAPGILALTTERVDILKTYARQPQTAAVLSAVTAAPLSGISLATIAIAPNASAAGTVSIAGTAATRSELIAFVDALKATPLFSGVSIPVSDLASQANVPFTLSFSYRIATP